MIGWETYGFYFNAVESCDVKSIRVPSRLAMVSVLPRYSQDDQEIGVLLPL